MVITYKGLKGSQAHIPSMLPGELWAGFIVGEQTARDIRVFIRTEGGLVDLESGQFYTQWTNKALGSARRLEGRLMVEDK